MVIAILLVILLFMAGLINTYFFKFPTKKFYVWLQSFFFGDSLVVSTIDSAPVPPVLSKEKTPPAHRKEELKRVFATFDKNSDGFITKLELRESLKNLRLFVTEKEAEEMVVKVDTNGDGLIDLDEFCILCEGTLMDGDERGEDNRGEGEGGGEEQELKEAFDVFDKDGDGLISVEELGLVLCSLGLKEGKKMEDCKEMIKRVDVDGDGMVNFDEFKRMMKRGGGLFSVS